MLLPTISLDKVDTPAWQRLVLKSELADMPVIIANQGR